MIEKEKQNKKIQKDNTPKSNLEYSFLKIELKNTYLSNSDEHVVDKRFESCNCASLFVSSVPHLDSNIETLHFGSGHFHDSDVNSDVAQILCDFTSWSFDCNLSCFDLDVDFTNGF